MRLPFTADQFLDVFRRYNDAVWPSQWVLIALALSAVAFSVRGLPSDGRRVSAILALLWLWSGTVYHLTFFSALTPMALVFAAAFAAQGMLFAWLASRPNAMAQAPRRRARGVAGAGLVLYALVGYPTLGWWLGHRYPAAPTFGVPCPTVIFTFGMLLWSRARVPWWVVAVPVLWAVVGMSAAVNLGMLEDFGLPVAAVATIVLSAAATRRARPSASTPAAFVPNAP